MGSPQACNVLIIDDYPDFVELLTLILATHGHRVTGTSSSGSQGLALAEQTPPDVVLVRLMLPGWDGYEICRRFKAAPALKHIPVLLFAAMDPRRVYPEARRCGAAGYLYQPFHLDEPITAIETVLRGEMYYPPAGD